MLKLILLVVLCQVAVGTYTSSSFPSGSGCAYNAGSNVYYPSNTYLSYPAGSQVTYTQPSTVYYPQQTTAYTNYGAKTYPANTPITYPSGTSISYAPGTSVVCGSGGAGMKYGNFNGNPYGIAYYNNGANPQLTAGSQASYFPPGTPSYTYYKPGGTTQYGPSAPSIGSSGYYYNTNGGTSYGTCVGYTGNGYPVWGQSTNTNNYG